MPQYEEQDVAVAVASKSVKSGTELLLEQQAKVQEAKDLKIAELLLEEVTLRDETEIRVKEIKQELKALGYHPLRKKRENSAENVPESLDKTAANS